MLCGFLLKLCPTTPISSLAIAALYRRGSYGSFQTVARKVHQIPLALTSRLSRKYQTAHGMEGKLSAFRVWQLGKAAYEVEEIRECRREIKRGRRKRWKKQVLGFSCFIPLTTSSLKPSLDEGLVLKHAGVYRITQEHRGTCLLPLYKLPMSYLQIWKEMFPQASLSSSLLLLLSRGETQVPCQRHPFDKEGIQKNPCD